MLGHKNQHLLYIIYTLINLNQSDGRDHNCDNMMTIFTLTCCLWHSLPHLTKPDRFM